MDIRFNLAKPRKVYRHNRTTKKVLSDKKISPKQEKGLAYEQDAIDYLRTHGLTLLQQNLSCPLGEIDVVMREHNTLVFVEVRFRQSAQFGGAVASINHHKLQRIQRAAYYFLPFIVKRHFQGITPFCRFDAVCIEGDAQEKKWLKNIIT